jgi:hypothetical protein
MIKQLLIDFADRFPHSQLSVPFTDLAAPALSCDEDYEPLWNRVNRICDQHLLNPPSRFSHSYSDSPLPLRTI